MFDTHSGIHILGLDAAGMTGVARLLREAGVAVSASARLRTSTVAELADSGDIAVFDGLEAEDVPEGRAVVVAPDMGTDSELLEALRARQIPLLSRGDVLAELFSDHHIIGVTGSHGSGTVSSMIAWILECAGQSPAFVVSAGLENFGVEARRTDGDWAVVELDERSPSELELPCDYGICSFFETEPFGSSTQIEAIRNGLSQFFENNSRLKEAFVNLDCRGVRSLVTDLALRPTGYALEHRAEYRGSVVEEGRLHVSFQAAHRERVLGEFQLQVPGVYNAVNAMGAIAVARRLGVGGDCIADALSSYEGMQNRYTVASGGGVLVVKDLVTHPAGIKQVLERTTPPGPGRGRLITAFKPHRYVLMKYLEDDYVRALSMCDEVILSRSDDGEAEPIRGARSQSLAEQLQDRGIAATYVAAEEEIADHILGVVTPGDRVVYFGGDAFLRQADQLLAALATRSERTAAEAEQPRLHGPLAEGGDSHE